MENEELIGYKGENVIEGPIFYVPYIPLDHELTKVDKLKMIWYKLFGIIIKIFAKKCEICNGNGWVFINDDSVDSIDCNYCNGKGYYRKWRFKC